MSPDRTSRSKILSGTLRCDARCSSSPPADLSTESLGSTIAAVSELAGDLDSAERRTALAAAIGRLDADADALERLRDPETAWRCLRLLAAGRCAG